MTNKDKKKAASIFPLLWIMLFDHTALNMTFPVLTLLFFDAQSNLFSPGTDAATRSLWYGLCVAIPHILNMIFTPILSILSDELGRKKILSVATFGAFLFALTAGFGVMLGLLSLVLLGRIIQGAFSRTNPIAQAIVGDVSYSHKIISMGYLQTAISLGAFIGPILGGYFASKFFFQTINFSAPFFIAAFCGAISFILTLTIFQETLRIEHNRLIKKSFPLQGIKKVLKMPEVLRLSIILFLLQCSWSLYYQFIPPIIKTQLHFNAHHLGLFVGLIALWLGLATTFGIKWLQRFFSLDRMLLFSIYLVLVGSCFTLAGLYFKDNFPLLIWIASIPLSVGDVIAYATLTVLYSDNVSKPEQGKVMAICFSVVALVWSFTAMLGGLLMGWITISPLVITPIPVLIAILLLHASFGKKIFNAAPVPGPPANLATLPHPPKAELNPQ